MKKKKLIFNSCNLLPIFESNNLSDLQQIISTESDVNGDASLMLLDLVKNPGGREGYRQKS